MSNRLTVTVFLVLIATVTNACWSSPAPPAANSPLPAERTVFPFEATEPAVYAARIVVAAGPSATEHFVARNGDRSRTDTNVGTASHISRIVGEREIVVSHAAKTYYELPRGNGDIAETGDSTPAIRGLFASPENAKFESMGTENGLTKYRVRFSQDERSEAYVFVGGEAGMIMRQEFYTGDGDSRTLVYSAEIRDLRLEAPDDVFAVPAGYKKVNAP